MSLGFVSASREFPRRREPQEVRPSSASLAPDASLAIECDDAPNGICIPRKTLTVSNLVLFLLHGGLSATTLLLGNLDLRVSLYANRLSAEQRGDAYELVPSSPYRLTYLYLTQAVALFFAISAFFHLGNATLWRRRYLNGISKCYCLSRWVEYSFSASVMIVLIAYFTGCVFGVELLAVAALTFTTMTFGHLTERLSRPASATEWQTSRWRRLEAHILGYIPQVSAWVIIVYTFANSAQTSATDAVTGEALKMPDFVYGIVAAELALFWGFGLVQMFVLLNQPRYYYRGEIAYQVLSLAAKALLGSLLLSNVLVVDTLRN